MDYEKDKHYDEKYCRRNTRGIAIGGLVTGIAGTVLGGAALMKRKGGLFGTDCNEPCAPNAYPGGYPYPYPGYYGGCEPYNCQAQDIYINQKVDCAKDKECEDVLKLTREVAGLEREIGNKALFLEREIYQGDACLADKICCGDLALERQIWSLALKAQKENCELGRCLDKEIDKVAAKEDRDVLNLYRNLDAVAFKSYKDAKQGDDCLAERICKLEKENAVLAATAPLRDVIIDEKIKKVALLAKFDLEKEMCRVVKGEVVLPNTPIVTGFAGVCGCGRVVTTADAAAASA